MTGPSSARPAPTIPGYTGLEEIARGGFAVVYKATQSSIGRPVAIKVIVRVDVDGRDQQRFEQECRVLGDLAWHPHIVVVFDAGSTTEGMPYLVMEHFERGTVADRVAREGPLPWQDVLAYGVQLAGALEAAHRSGVIHRDIKPRNILLGALGEAKLSDFGIALSGDATGRTGTGQISGTMAHVAPEMLSGSRANERTDIYALGSTLYEILTGQAAFVRPDEETVVPLITRISTQRPESLSTLGVPADFEEIIQACMAKGADERPAGAEDLGRRLQEVQVAHGLPRSELHLLVDEAPRPDPSATLVSGLPPAPEVTQPGAHLDRTGETVTLPGLPEPSPRLTVELPPLPAASAAPPPVGPPPTGGSYLPPLDPTLRPPPGGRAPSSGSPNRWVLIVAGVAVAGILAGVVGSSLLNKDDDQDPFGGDPQDESRSVETTSDEQVLSLGSDVFGSVGVSGTATFQVVGPGDDVAVHVAGVGGFDPTVTVRDSSGSEVAFNDDVGGSRDSEAVLFMGSGERFTVEVRGFSEDSGDFELSIVDAQFSTTASSFFFFS